MYKFREGFRAPKGLTAEEVFLELEKIRETAGEITAETTVEAAKDENCPLHKAGFEWDVYKAAEEHWKDHARKLIKSVIVVSGEKQTERPAMVLVAERNSGQETRRYMPTEIAMSDDGMAGYVIARVKAQIASGQKTLTSLLEMKGELSPAQRRAARQAAGYIGRAAEAAARM